MKPIVELITEWTEFEEKRQEVTIEDFCKYVLARKKVEEDSEKLFKGMQPPDVDATLAKLIGRIAAMHQYHSKNVLKEKIKDLDLDGFYFLNAIFHLGKGKKKDVINYNFYEQSTGIDILNRLLKADFISEQIDPNDKRAKLVQITSKGEHKLFQCWEELSLVNLLVFKNLTTQDKSLIIALLRNTEIQNWELIEKNSTNSFMATIEHEFGKDKLKKFRDGIRTLIKKFN